MWLWLITCVILLSCVDGANEQVAVGGMKFYLMHDEQPLTMFACISQIAQDPQFRYNKTYREEETGWDEELEKYFPLVDVAKQPLYDNKLVGYPVQDAGLFYLLRAARNHPNRVYDASEAEVVLNLAFINELIMAHAAVFGCGGRTRQDRMVAHEQNLVDMLELSTSLDIPFVWVCQSFRCGYYNALLPNSAPLWNNLIRHPKGLFVLHERNWKWMHHFIAFDANTRMLPIPYLGHSSLRLRRYEKDTKRILGTFYFAGAERGTRVREILMRLNDLEGVSTRQIEAGKSDAEQSAAYVAGLLGSEFCFVPRGDTPTSRRLFDVVLAGCIPVVISNEIDLPFLSVVPWEDMIIRVAEAMFLQYPERVVQRIRELPLATRNKMREAIGTAWPNIDYQHKHTVFDNLLHGVREHFRDS